MRLHCSHLIHPNESVILDFALTDTSHDNTCIMANRHMLYRTIYSVLTLKKKASKESKRLRSSHMHMLARTLIVLVFYDEINMRTMS